MFQKKVVEMIKTHILYSTTFFFPRIVPFMRLRVKMWHSQTDHALRRIRFALLDHKFIYFIKATDTHSEYVILIFPRQQWLRESASMLCFMCIVCLINFVIKYRMLIKLTRRMNKYTLQLSQKRSFPIYMLSVCCLNTVYTEQREGN